MNDDVKVLQVVGRDSDEVDGERALGAAACFGDLAAEFLGRHVAAGEGGEGASFADSGDEIRLADPGHGAAHDGVLNAEQGFTA